MNKRILFGLITIALVYSCAPRKWVITEAESHKIAIDSSTQSEADKQYTDWLQPYKNTIDAEMNVVIGRSTQNMRAHKPESLLSNFSADVYLEAASTSLKTQIDVAIVNLGGLRTQIPEGNITVRKVFELMPFENELVVLWLRGDKLNELLQGFAAIGGQGVAGLQMTIVDRKATQITVQGKPIEETKLYSIATNDYLAGGNDQMDPLALYEKREDTGLKIRDILMDFIIKETAEGRPIKSKLDGRIK